VILEALAAIYRLVATRLERNLRLLATVSTDSGKHLTGSTVSVFLSTECSTALGAATRFILEAFLSIEFLLRC
jgi:hypothetical protein